MVNANTPAPIIIRKKAPHQAHHGGAWKVAYADFVTALMALFIVLWLMACSEQVKRAISLYFRDPKGLQQQVGSGLVGSGESMAFSKQDLEKLKEKLQQELLRIPELRNLRDQVSMTVTGEGLRIELLENPKGVFFENGNAKPTRLGVETISLLARELGKLPNNILVEGHTDSTPYQSDSEYSNWELSADRANRARRLMREAGVRPDQVREVRGYADQSLRNEKNPRDSANRRISVIVQYQHQDLKQAIQFLANH